jgi:hypothetical protein
MGWNDPRWQQLYPPTATNATDWIPTEPDFAHTDGRGTPGEQVPHYLDLIAAEAAAVPAPTYGNAPGINIADGPGGLI